MSFPSLGESSPAPLISNPADIQTLEPNEITLDVTPNITSSSIHHIPPFIRFRAPPPLSSSSIRSLRFFSTTFSNSHLASMSTSIHLPTLFPSAALVTLTNCTFDYTPLPSLGFAC